LHSGADRIRIWGRIRNGASGSRRGRPTRGTSTPLVGGAGLRRNGTEIIRGGGDYVWRYSAVPGQGALFNMVFEGGGNPTFASQLGDDPRKLLMDDGEKKYALAPAQ